MHGVIPCSDLGGSGAEQAAHNMAHGSLRGPHPEHGTKVFPFSWAASLEMARSGSMDAAAADDDNDGEGAFCAPKRGPVPQVSAAPQALHKTLSSGSTEPQTRQWIPGVFILKPAIELTAENAGNAKTRTCGVLKAA